MSASLASQKAFRAALTADDALLALVPANLIVDSNAGLDTFPAIVLGEDQELPADSVGRYTTLHSNIHIWVREAGLGGAKEIAGAVRRILSSPQRSSWTRDGYRSLDVTFEGSRFLRDPDGVTSHGIVSFRSTIEELA